MTRIGHRALVTLAVLPWALGVALFGVAWALIMLADKLWTGATSGNCWSYAGPRWSRAGGYLLVRWADGVPVLHVAHVTSLEPLEMTHFVPSRRLRGWRGLLNSLYHAGHVADSDKRVR